MKKRVDYLLVRILQLEKTFGGTELEDGVK